MEAAEVGNKIGVRMSFPSPLGGALICAMAAGCWGLGPTELLFLIGSRPFMYEDEAVKLTNTSASNPELDLTVLTRNLITQESREQQITLRRPEAISLKLDVATIPDLAAGPALVPVQLSVIANGQEPRWSGLLQGMPKAWQQEARFKVVLEDSAIGSALAWGGRSLQVSKDQATAAEIASLPGAGTYIPPVEFFWFEITGTFPKHVVPAAFSGAGADTVGVPKAARILLPRIRQPFAVRVAVIL